MPSVCGSVCGSMPGIVAPVTRPPIETAASSPVTSATRRANGRRSIDRDLRSCPGACRSRSGARGRSGTTASVARCRRAARACGRSRCAWRPRCGAAARRRRSSALVACADRRRHLGVLADRERDRVGALAQVADEVDGDGLPAREARVGLAGLVVADEAEQHEADARHRHDHDEHEERDELVRKLTLRACLPCAHGENAARRRRLSVRGRGDPFIGRPRGGETTDVIDVVSAGDRADQ